MRPLLRQTALTLAALVLLTTQAMAASQAGFRRINVPANGPAGAPTVVALYFPTLAAENTVSMGPFSPRVAMGGKPDDQVKGLILLSHGTGGTEVGHTSLAEALARQGYLVAALRHPGDNWQDRTLLKTSPDNYFAERPRQASHVITALLNDPEWKNRIAADARGPKVGALGHSAGGYTVLALAGARPDGSRLASHCSENRAQDPIFCSMGGAVPATPAGNAAAVSPAAATAAASTAATTNSGAPLADPRVRAVVAMAPVGAVFGAQSFADVRVPVMVYSADKDRFLVPRFHAEWVGKNLSGASLQRVPNALHFAFMDTPSFAIPTEDGDIATDAPGFKRQDFLRQLQREIPAFFDKALR